MNNMNGIIDLIKTRQSCRSFSGERVPKEKLSSILEAAILSPSARNSQPWDLTLAASDDAVLSVGECTRAGGKNKFTEKCSAFIVITERDCEDAFGGAKHRYFAEMDIGMCVMNMCLQAEALGVASCILGAFDSEKLRSVVNAPDNCEIKLVIALGYAEDGYPVREKTRRSFDSVVKII